MKLYKAFTLIELLVVIAIIAILAAILFPVFAQAKDAAKTTVALSNVKQTALGIIMYTGDNDDMFPLDWDSHDITGTGYWTWQTRIYPYVKSFAVMLNPKIQPPSGPTAYWQRLLHMGMMPDEAAVPNAPMKAGHFVANDYFTNNGPVLYDGISGFGSQGYGYGSGTVLSASSLTTTSIGAPSDFAMVTPAANWDFFVGVYGISAFDYCGGWGSYSIIPGDYGFFGPISIKPNPHSGVDVGCYLPNGLGLMAAVDGHAKTMDFQGQLMKSQPLNDGSGNLAFTHFWVQGIQ
jgi:prepilin-type N-terminal cleavage/methylation domain-containing protein